MNYKKYAESLYSFYQSNPPEKFEGFFDNFIRYLQKKNKIILLPKILREIKKNIQIEKNNLKSKIILKNKNDFAKYQDKLNKYQDFFNLKELEIIENKNIVGGYILKNKKYKIDNSYKKKLLSLYNKIVQK